MPTGRRTWMSALLPMTFLALITTLLSGCNATSGAALVGTPTSTVSGIPTQMPLPTATPTLVEVHGTGGPVPGKTATWTRANLPDGYGLAFHQTDLQIAESDGNTAYACAVPGGATTPGHPRVIVTHDAGNTWSATATIAATWGACAQLAVDVLHPEVMVAEEDFSLGPSVVTFDGGASWRALPSDGKFAILRLATYQGHAIALLAQPNGNNASIILGESDDHLNTWRSIGGMTGGDNIRGFWVNPGSGAILVQTYSTGLWETTDDGAHWQPVWTPIPAQYSAQSPTAGSPWRMCATYFASNTSSDNSIVCTFDGAKSWMLLPSLGSGAAQIVGIATDGAVLVEVGAGSQNGGAVYRFPQGATRWQSLGPLPPRGSSAYFRPSEAGGIFWLLPAESDGAAIPDNPNDVYSAPYPY